MSCDTTKKTKRTTSSDAGSGDGDDKHHKSQDQDSTGSFPTTITPNIWFNDNAEEAVNLYISVFENSSNFRVDRYTDVGKEHHGHNAGEVQSIEFILANQHFIAINGGPQFPLNPSISFYVACSSKEEVDSIYKKLKVGGSDLMALGEYPFSSYYAWVVDKFGVSWQINISTKPVTQKIAPALLFTKDKCGKAEAAIKKYSEIFPASKPDISRYPADAPACGGPPNGVSFSSMTVFGYEIHIQESDGPHAFGFNPAVSLMLTVDSQKEIDQYWTALSADPKAEQCGWLVDEFGVSWQIVPKEMNDMLTKGTPEQIKGVTEVLFTMKKFDVQTLVDAYNK